MYTLKPSLTADCFETEKEQQLPIYIYATHIDGSFDKFCIGFNAKLAKLYCCIVLISESTLNVQTPHGKMYIPSNV